MPNVGGVLYIESFWLCVRYCNIVGRSERPRSARSLRMITSVTPDGPRFFCAPAKIIPYFATSMGREAMSEDMSATMGAVEAGVSCHCVPSMVLLVHRCVYEASAESLISSGR